MSFAKLSPLFRDSLREAIDRMAPEKKARTEEKTACAPCGSGVPSGDEKKQAVEELQSLIVQVDQRLVTDWLYALDEASREEVKRLFLELRDLSAAEFVLLMKSSGACCPWQFIGSMFATEDESSQAPNEILIVEESCGTAIQENT